MCTCDANPSFYASLRPAIYIHHTVPSILLVCPGDLARQNLTISRSLCASPRHGNSTPFIGLTQLLLICPPRLAVLIVSRLLRVPVILIRVGSNEIWSHDMNVDLNDWRGNSFLCISGPVCLGIRNLLLKYLKSTPQRICLHCVIYALT